MNTVIALSANQTAWWITLAVGLIVAIVVAVLLEMLRRTVLGVEQSVSDAWDAGKRVEHNTVMTYLLQRTRERGTELVDELGYHG